MKKDAMNGTDAEALRQVLDYMAEDPSRDTLRKILAQVAKENPVAVAKTLVRVAYHRKDGHRTLTRAAFRLFGIEHAVDAVLLRSPAIYCTPISGGADGQELYRTPSLRELEELIRDWQLPVSQHEVRTAARYMQARQLDMLGMPPKKSPKPN